MKKLIFLFFFFSAVNFSNAQFRKIPANVTDAFAARYPHATKVEWKDKLQYFQASFELNGSNIIAHFSSDGEWKVSEREMDFNDLPDEVKDGFQKSKYENLQINGVYEVQEMGKPLQYRIFVQKSGLQKKQVYFDANGKLLKDNMVL
jgi:hypothetical protein